MARSDQQSLPSACTSATEVGAAVSGPRRVTVATRCGASMATVTCRYSILLAETWGASGSSWMPLAPSLREGWAAARAARSRTPCSNFERGKEASISFHSRAFLALQPSARVENMSARSRRILRLSTRRVSPPVPGSTPRSGTSGR